MGKEWTLAENDAQGEWTLPDGWVKAPVSEIYDIIGGGTPSTKVEEYWQGDIPWISSADIHGPRDIRPRRGITKSAIENSATNLVPAGSLIVVTRVGLGKVALAYTSICFSQDSQALVGSSDFVLPDYAIYYLSQAVQVFKHRSRGTTIAGVTKKQLADLPFALPPLPEQRRIVAEIETQFTRLDAAVAALERAQANIRRYRAAVLKAACEGRLVPTEAELARVGAHRDAPLPYEPADQLLARILAERRARWEAEHPGKRYQEPTPPDTENLPELTEGWVWASLEILASDRRHSISSGPFGSALGTKDYRESGVPVIRGQNVADGQLILDSWVYVSEEKAAQLERSVARPGDLVVVAVGSSGRPAIVPPSLPKAILSQNCNKITPDTNLIFPKYLVFAMQIGIIQEQLDQKTTDTVRKFLSLTNLRKTLIPLPPFAEQRRIVAEVERRLSVVAALEASVGAALVRAGRLRQAVLKQAFEGRLVPQDPDDEPASVLLERIRAERAQRGRERSDRKAQPKQMELF
jgi:type I restriction enzyme S subunit